MQKTIKNNNDKKSAVTKIQKKVEISKTKVKYASGKLCNIILHEITDDGCFTLNTPFGSVVIYKNKSHPKDDALIFNSPKNYNDIAKWIEQEIKQEIKQEIEKDVTKKLKEELKNSEDKEIDKKEQKDLIKKQYENVVKERFKEKLLPDLEKVQEYLSIENDPYMENIESFKKIISKKMALKKIYLRKDKPVEDYDCAFTNLCGLLMFCEPYRFKDGGGLSRQSIRATIKELKNGNIDALSKIFGNKGRKFKGANEAEAIFTHNTNPKRNDYSNKMQDNLRGDSYGGKNQTLNIIQNTKFNENDDSINDNIKRIENYADCMSDNEDAEKPNCQAYEKYDAIEWENKFKKKKYKDEETIIAKNKKRYQKNRKKHRIKKILKIFFNRNNKNSRNIITRNNLKNIRKIDPSFNLNTLSKDSSNTPELLKRKRKRESDGKDKKFKKPTVKKTYTEEDEMEIDE